MISLFALLGAFSEGPCFLYLKEYGVRLHFSMCDSVDSRKVKTWSKNAKAHYNLR